MLLSLVHQSLDLLNLTDMSQSPSFLMRFWGRSGMSPINLTGARISHVYGIRVNITFCEDRIQILYTISNSLCHCCYLFLDQQQCAPTCAEQNNTVHDLRSLQSKKLVVGDSKDHLSKHIYMYTCYNRLPGYSRLYHFLFLPYQNKTTKNMKGTPW